MRPRSVFVPSQLLDLADAIGFDPREAIKLTVPDKLLVAADE
jgi:hypothetical protein